MKVSLFLASLYGRFSAQPAELAATGSFASGRRCSSHAARIEVGRDRDVMRDQFREFCSRTLHNADESCYGTLATESTYFCLCYNEDDFLIATSIRFFAKTAMIGSV